MDSLSAQKVITDQLKLVLSNQERIMSIISVLQMAIGKIRNQFTSFGHTVGHVVVREPFELSKVLI